MAKRIEITADISSLKASLRDVKNLIKDTTKSPQSIKVFTDKDQNFLKDWAKKQVPLVGKEITRIRKEYYVISKQAHDTGDIDLLVKTRKSAEKISGLIKDLKSLQRVSEGKIREESGIFPTYKTYQDRGVLRRPSPTIFKQAQGMAKQTERTEDEGNLSTGLSTMGSGLIRKLAPYVGALALGHRVMSGFNQRMGEAEPRLRLAGRLGGQGYQDFIRRGTAYSGRRYGYDVNETLQQSNQLIGEVGNLDQLGKLQRTARAYGMDTGELAGQMGGFRRVAGQENVEKNFSNLLASAITSNLDQSLLSEYMKETAEFTQQMAKEGTPDMKQMMYAVSGLVRQGGLFKDTARTTKSLNSLDSMIKNAEGAGFTFFSNAMERALGPQATGSQRLLALNQGLFGADTSRLTALSERQKQDLSLNGVGFKERSKGITKEFDNLTEGMDTASKALVATKITGISNAGEAMNFMEALKKGNLNPKELQKQYERAKASPEEKALMDIDKTLDMGFEKVAAKNTENLSHLGEQVAPMILNAKDALLDIEDRTLIPIMKNVGKLVDYFVGPQESVGSKLMDKVADLFSGGKVTASKEYMKKESDIDLLSKLRQEGNDLPLQKSLKRLYSPDQNITDYDIEKIEEGKKKANPMQRKKIEYEAWEGISDRLLSLSRAKEEGKPLKDETLIKSSIRSMKQLIPTGQEMPKQLAEKFAGIDEKLKPVMIETAKSLLGDNSDAFAKGLMTPRKDEKGFRTPLLKESKDKLLKMSAMPQEAKKTDFTDILNPLKQMIPDREEPQVPFAPNGPTDIMTPVKDSFADLISAIDNLAQIFERKTPGNGTPYQSIPVGAVGGGSFGTIRRGYR